LAAQRCICGSCDSACCEIGYGEPSELSYFSDQLERDPIFLSFESQALFGKIAQLVDPSLNFAEMAHCFDDVASSGLTFGSDHGSALVYPAECLADIGSATHKGGLEGVFVDVKVGVGRGKDLGFVDEVDAERLQNLSFSQVSDAYLGHYGDAHRFLDILNHLRVAHARDPAFAADVSGHSLKRHDGHGSGIFRDASLFYVDDVHDDAVAQHTSQAHLDLEGWNGGTLMVFVGTVSTIHVLQKKYEKWENSIW
jgi:hypothetical protein